MNDSEHAASLKMQVPERILVAGGNSHVAAKNLPRELQLENSVLSPSPEQVSNLDLRKNTIKDKVLTVPFYRNCSTLFVDSCFYTSKVNSLR